MRKSKEHVCHLSHSPSRHNITSFISFEVMDYEPLVVFQTPKYYWPVIDDAIRSAAYRWVMRGV